MSYIEVDLFLKIKDLLIVVECIRLLLMNNNDTSSTISIQYHLARMLNISNIIKPQMESTTTRILIMISQINALRWCLNGSMTHCLVELDKATQMESSIGNDHNRPYILHIHASELLAFYLLITHRYYSPLALTYPLNNSIVSITEFPSYALRLYNKENQTEPHRAVNLLGIARAYSQMGRIDEASQIYERFLRDWSDSTFSPEIDRVVITEAVNYLLEVKLNQTRNHGLIVNSSVSLINVLIILLFINEL